MTIKRIGVLVSATGGRGGRQEQSVATDVLLPIGRDAVCMAPSNALHTYTHTREDIVCQVYNTHIRTSSLSPIKSNTLHIPGAESKKATNL